MPQLDVSSYFVQLILFMVIFIIFYYYITFFILPLFSNILKYRKKLMFITSQNYNFFSQLTFNNKYINNKSFKNINITFFSQITELNNFLSKTYNFLKTKLQILGSKNTVYKKIFSKVTTLVGI